jgi:hypothetical protein
MYCATQPVDDQQRRCSANAECPDRLQMLGDVYFDMRDIRVISQDPLDQRARLRADRTELTGELDY